MAAMASPTQSQTEQPPASAGGEDAYEPVVLSPATGYPVLGETDLEVLRGIGKRWQAALGPRARWIRALPCDPNLGQPSTGAVRLGRTRFVPVEVDGAPGEELEGYARRGLRPHARRPDRLLAAARAARSRAAQRGGARGAHAQADRAAGALLRRALLGRLRPRSDARRARARGRQPRSASRWGSPSRSSC